MKNRRLVLILAKSLHTAGVCNYDYGTWDEMIDNGNECECFDLAEVQAKILKQYDIKIQRKVLKRKTR